jgi:glycosyltransferase 2 family protein
MLNKNHLVFLFKLLVSGGLSYYIYISIPWGDVSNVILSASLDLLVLSIFFQFISFILLGFRWSLIVRNSNLSLNIIEIIKISLIGAAFNNILPGSIGGDFVRGAYIVKKGISLKNSILSLVADRVLSFFSVLVFICTFLIFYTDKNVILSEINIFIMLMIIGMLLVMLILKTRLFNKIIFGFLLKIFSAIYYEKAISMIDDLYQYSINKNLAIKVFLITIVAMVLEILVFWLASESLGMNYSFYIFVISAPLITIISALPISLGGLLVREASGLFLFSLLGIEFLHASSIVILFIPIILISSLPGLYYYIKNSNYE